jgi:hypothetical protein
VTSNTKSALTLFIKNTTKRVLKAMKHQAKQSIAVKAMIETRRITLLNDCFSAFTSHALAK